VMGCEDGRAAAGAEAAGVWVGRMARCAERD
jgi:hypothetical protein